MPIYMIGYDLHPSEGEKYGELYTALEALGSSGYWDCLDSTWLVITEKTAAQVRDVLKQHLREDDRLLVVRCGEGASWYGFKDECQTWLEDNLQASSAVT